MSKSFSEAIRNRDPEHCRLLRPDIESCVKAGFPVCRKEYSDALEAMDEFERSDGSDIDWTKLGLSLSRLDQCIASTPPIRSTVSFSR